MIKICSDPPLELSFFVMDRFKWSKFEEEKLERTFPYKI
jgi:hypothetical protein